MKSKPLDLEDIEKKVLKELPMVVGDTYTKISEEKRIEQVIKGAIKLTKEEIKQRIKSACDFYLRYKDNPDLFGAEHPEYFEEMLGYAILTNRSRFKPTKKYNTWLFKLAFKDVIVAKGKDEATGEAVDVTSRRQAHYNTKNQSDEGKTRANEGD